MGRTPKSEFRRGQQTKVVPQERSADADARRAECFP